MSAGLDCLELLLAVLVRWVDECGALQQVIEFVSFVKKKNYLLGTQ